MPQDPYSVRISKYKTEDYPLAVNFIARLRTGETVVSATVTIQNVDGLDCSATMVGSISVTSPQVIAILLPDVGTVGQEYSLKFVAVTQNDRLEQLVILDIL